MKVALHTVDLFPGRERLMPFRTVLEVAKVMCEHGWDAHVVNSPVLEFGQKDYEYQGVQIVQAPREFCALSQWVNENGYDVFFFAATIREGLKDLSGLGEMKCKKIAYIPSGISPKANAFWMMRMYGMYAKAWMLEAFTPKFLLGRKLRKAGFTDIIGLTDYTSQRVNEKLPVHTIYPGKDDFENIESDESFLIKNNLKNQKYYLFTGGPAPSRGGAVLLRAFDDMVERFKEEGKRDIPKLVFLMRQDVGGEYEALFRVLDELKYKEQVLVLKDKLTISQLKAYFESAYAVVLPFICIPAEIPLTYYEVMSCGTPVISFENAGTTEYLHDGIMFAQDLSEEGLSFSLSKLWFSQSLRDELGANARRIISKHPTWNQVGGQWTKVIIGDKCI